MQRANELCNHIKTLLHERDLSEITLYACDFCGSNTNIDNFEEVEYHEESEVFSLEQLVKTFGEESVTAHLENIYRTLTSAEWLFELNSMKKS